MDQPAHVEAVEEAYQQARSAIARYRLPEARRHLDEAKRLLDGIGGDARFELDLRLRLTESWLICDDLGLSPALEQVSAARIEAEQAGRDDLRGLAHIQAGVLNARTGHLEEALAELRAAVEVSGSLPVEDRVRLLINKGAIGSQTGELSEAADDLRAAAGMAADLPEYAFMATHNLGFVEYLRGDLPAALARMAEADELVADVDRAVSRLDRARVLMEVGLVDEAIGLLHEATGAMRQAGMSVELADTLLELARCALLRGDTAEAVAIVEEIVAGAGRRGEEPRILEARMVRLESLAVDTGAASHTLVGEAAELMRSAKQAHGDWLADRATALWVILAVRAGEEINDPQITVRLRRMRRSPYLATRTLAVLAQLGLATTPARRGRLVRAAAADVAASRAGMASLDLRTAVAIHISPVVALDLQWAVADGARAALSATERWRTALDSVPSVLPPADPTVAALWSKLRQHHEELRDAPPQQVGPLRSEAARIERQLREQSWAGGTATWPARRRPPRRDELGPATVLSYFWAADTAYMVRLLPGEKAELVSLGSRRELTELVARVTADAHAATRVPPGPLAAAVRGSLMDSLARLDPVLLPGHLGEGPVVIVPGGSLVHLPWGMLPRLRHRSITVSRSVTAWHVGNTHVTTAPSIAVAAGPGLGLGKHEADAVRASWPWAHEVHGGPDAVAAALTGHDVVHVAAHGEHRADNPLFSSLRLHGGSLFAHELEGITLASSLVVLSACSAGRANLRPGDEALGLTSSLLAMGVKAVVAPLTDVPDDVACETMAEMHRRLAAGEDGPSALAAASDSLLARSFTWFGSNWRAGNA